MKRLVWLTLLVAGCAYLPAVGPSYHGVKLDLPSAYREAAGAGEVSSTVPYWRQLGDPTLVLLEEKALAQSLTLQQAWQRIKQARAGSRMAFAALGPQVQGQGKYDAQRIGAQANLINGTTQTLDIFGLGVGAAWEIDLFGGNRRALESADARAAQAVAAGSGMTSAVLAEVARQYVTLRALQQQVALAECEVSATATLATLVGHQARVGMVDGTVLAQAQSRAAGAVMQLAPLQAAVSGTQYHLESLLGEQPGRLAEVLASGTLVLPALPPSSSLVLPSTLINQRPDVVVREREVAAATADIGVAMADLFPRFSLTGSYGVQAQRPGGLDEPSALVWRGGPEFRWTLFAMGQVWQNVKLQRAKQREAILAYQQAVLDALADVESQLAQSRATRTALTAAGEVATQAKRRAELVTLQHATGSANGLMWQEALIGGVQGEKAATQAQLEALLGYINVHQSLGL